MFKRRSDKQWHQEEILRRFQDASEQDAKATECLLRAEQVKARTEVLLRDASSEMRRVSEGRV